MKNRFAKTILGFMIFNVAFMLNGFCVFQFTQPSHIINTAQAATVKDASVNSRDLTTDDDSCGDDVQSPQTESDQAQKTAVPSVEKNETERHSGRSVLPCCVDGSHERIGVNISPESKKIEFSKIVPVSFMSQFDFPVVSNKILCVYDRVFSPPELAIIKTTILRL